MIEKTQAPSDVEAAIAAEVDRQLAESEDQERARRRASAEAKVRERFAKEQRRAEASRLIDDANKRRPKLAARIPALTEGWNKACAAAKAAQDELRSAHVALNELDQQVAKAQALLEQLRDDPIRDLIAAPTLDGVLEFVNRLEPDANGPVGIDSFRFAQHCTLLVDAVVRARRKLTRDEQRRVDEYMLQRFGLGPLSVRP
jgi:hypothetical protein